MTGDMVDVDATNAKMGELELQRNWALTRCAELAALNTVLGRALDTERKVVAAQAAALEAVRRDLVATQGRTVDNDQAPTIDETGAPLSDPVPRRH